MLQYVPTESQQLELRHEVWKKSGSGKTQVYVTPNTEFDLLHISLEAGEEEGVVSGGIDGPAVFVVLYGAVVLSLADGESGETLPSGQVVLVKPGTEYRWKVEGGSRVEVWGAFAE